MWFKDVFAPRFRHQITKYEFAFSTAFWTPLLPIIHNTFNNCAYISHLLYIKDVECVEFLLHGLWFLLTFSNQYRIILSSSKWPQIPCPQLWRLLASSARSQAQQFFCLFSTEQDFVRSQSRVDWSSLADLNIRCSLSFQKCSPAADWWRKTK